MAADRNAVAEFPCSGSVRKIDFRGQRSSEIAKSAARFSREMGAGFGGLFFLCFPREKTTSAFMPARIRILFAATVCAGIFSPSCRERTGGNRGPAAETQ